MTNLITRNGQKLQLVGNLVTGDTYPVKDFLKTYASGKWDKEAKGWRVDANKLQEMAARGNHIGLRVDDSPTTTARPRRATGTAATNGWCDLCHSYCWGDCQTN